LNHIQILLHKEGRFENALYAIKQVLVNSKSRMRSSIRNSLFKIAFILITVSASIASGQDYIVQLKSLVVSKISDEKFQIKGEIVNNTDKELKRFSIKCIIYNPSGEVVEEDQILPFAMPIPPHGSSPFLLPIRYKPDMDKLTIKVISFVGKEIKVDAGGKPLEYKVPR
jgi:hypothetical protein